MYLENVVFDAADPCRLGRFWESVVSGENLTDEPGIFETRLSIPGGPDLDLCFQPVPEPATVPARLHLDLARTPGYGPIAGIRLESGDPVRDARFWSWLTGWAAEDETTPWVLRHPSGRGPALALVPERSPKTATKNRTHLDVRLESGDDPEAVEGGILAHGGRVLPALAEGLPWRLYADPSGNEFCILPAR